MSWSDSLVASDEAWALPTVSGGVSEGLLRRWAARAGRFWSSRRCCNCCGAERWLPARDREDDTDDRIGLRV
ncbi:hypothetical protein GCM10010289_83230 [Streptomyces violascens]|uniref:Uncharacterized protein n=1 Tax=Streptomyces violascens TaxID=67381 RepID=A0ABQ3QSV0_9ACTN|nr:hypothetical protein GCM10010289_83230 [Streptomyces violascens]GHI40351.1 hypothetical protein Sviol_47590 [Streptomyces violascens]